MNKTLLVIIFISESLFAAGFDCNKAETQVEKMICSNPFIGELDDRLNHLYEKAKSSENKKEIIAKIREWLKSERNQCQTEVCLQNAYNNFFPKLELAVKENIEEDSEKNKNVTNNNLEEKYPYYTRTNNNNQDKKDTKESNNIENIDAPNKNQKNEYQNFEQDNSKNNKDKHQEIAVDSKPKADDYTSWWLTAFGGIGIWFWNKFIRNRCPDCNSTNFAQTSEDEVDRWKQAVKVTETLSNGKSREKHVTKTFIKVQYTYKCRDCGRIWSITEEREK